VQALSGVAGGYDLPLIAAIVTVVGTFVVLLNVAADVAGAWLDPRIRRRSASGLIPLPRAIDSRPRTRLALNVAVAAAMVALLAVAIEHPISHAGTSARLTGPIRTVTVNWDDITRIQGMIPAANSRAPVLGHGYLETKVTAVELGKSGWRVHASVSNVGNVPVRVRSESAPGVPVRYPLQPFSLIVQVDNGAGIKELEPLPATSFRPPLPKELKGGAKWVGTFGGGDPVAKGTLFYVGFGLFDYESTFDPRSFSTSSAKSAAAP